MLTRPGYIHSSRIGHGTTAVLNARTGRWIWLDEDSRRVWDAALAGRLPDLVQEVTGPGLTADRAQEIINGIVAALAEQGLLRETRRPDRLRRCFTSWRTA